MNAMIRSIASKLYQRLTAGEPARRHGTPRRPRLGLEGLEAREVPAAFTWTGAVNTDAMNPDNWSIYGTPGDGDDVYFGAMSPGAHNCNNLSSIDTAYGFNSITLAADFNGTVSVAQDSVLATNTFTLAGGAIAQPGPYSTPIDIYGLFTWTGGVLNSALNSASVNIFGGGTITTPSGGLTTGSTLNFASSDGTVKTTTISGSGNLTLAGTDEYALNVYANADVQNEVTNVNNPAAIKGLSSDKKVLTLNTGAQWAYYGEGTRTDEIRVVNNGGLFGVGMPKTGTKNIILKLTPSNANNYEYTQTGNTNTKLLIFGSCTLDATTGKGVAINGGLVFVMPNKNFVGITNQVATVKGTYTMTAGALGTGLVDRLTTTVGTVTGVPVWYTFKVDGDVNWSGGVWVPGVDARGGAMGNLGSESNADLWMITGKLTITANPVKANTPSIKAVTYQAPAGQLTGTWNSIKWGTLAALSPDPDPQDSGFTVFKNVPGTLFQVKK